MFSPYKIAKINSIDISNHIPSMRKQVSKTTKIRAVGFDFDNTLIFSEKEKEKIVEEIFSNKYSLKKTDIRREYFKIKGKCNRENKFKKLIKVLLNRKATPEELNQLNFSFSKGYAYKLSECPIVTCKHIFRELREQVDFLFLLTLENKKDVAEIAKHCEVAKYFDEILGGPVDKITNLQHIIKKYHLKPQEILYVGDMEGDVISSEKLNIQSIGITKDFKYEQLLKELGAEFTFTDVCKIPYKKIVNGVDF